MSTTRTRNFKTSEPHIVKMVCEDPSGNTRVYYDTWWNGKHNTAPFTDEGLEQLKKLRRGDNADRGTRTPRGVTEAEKDALALVRAAREQQGLSPSRVSNGNGGGSREAKVEPGFVYAIRRAEDGAFKTGHSDDPKERLKDAITWNPYPVELRFVSRWFEDAYAAEQAMHARLAEYAIDAGGGAEWFDAPLDVMLVLFGEAS